MSGRATSGGIVFQSEVAASVAALLLSGRPISRIGDNLPGIPKKIFLEAPSPVDDIKVLTEKGLIFFQAKRTLSLSSNNDSELCSVVDQFVRQFSEGVSEDNQNRNLDVLTDRLVIAVSQNAPSTVRNDLREVLEKYRTGAATALPNNLQHALDIFTKLINACWLKENGSTASPANIQDILMLCAVVVIDNNTKSLATDVLRDLVSIKGQEIVLFDLLVNWAAEGSQDGTGGDQTAIRMHLTGKISLVEPLNFKSDVQVLTKYSETVLARLLRFTKISTELGEVTFSRPVSSVILKAVQSGSLAITGDPGSGKSGIIHSISTELKKTSRVITLTVETNISTLEALQRDIGLEHSIIDVCKNMAISTKAYLILDALDATRGGIAEATYKKLIQEVSLLPNWYVIASVRTFDLKLGVEWRRLFKGIAPDNKYTDPSFQAVRHIHVPQLSEEEIEEIGNKSPSLKMALTGGDKKLICLARNPFNLSLIGELLEGGISPIALFNVGTRSELLNRYWSERLDDLGLPATIAMKTLVDLILSERAIDIPETEIPQDASITIQEIQARGVLITEQTRRIGFRHHVLFDFAVSRLILVPDLGRALSRLSKNTGAGLLISPSLEYWIDALRNKHSNEDYWRIVSSIIGSENTDPVIKVEVARIVVENVNPKEELISLSKVLSEDDPELKKAITHLAGTVNTFGIKPENADTWAIMISNIDNLKESYQLGSLSVIITALLETPLTEVGRQALGKICRILFDAISKEDYLIQWLSRVIIPFITKTYDSNQKESKNRLIQIFSKERFKKFGHIEIPCLADEVLSFAKYDDDLVARLYRCVFNGADFSSDQKTSMGNSNWIMPLTSNALQDFHLAEYILSSSYAKLFEESYDAAIRAVAAALDGKSKLHETKDFGVHYVTYLDEKKAFIEDNSAIWAWDIEEGNDHEDNIYKAFLCWITDVRGDILIKVPELILTENSKALAWRILFDSGTKQPEILGKIMWNSATDPITLSSLNTRKSAIEMIAATYPYKLKEELRKSELQILSYDFAHTTNPHYFKKYVFPALFNAIGFPNLVTQEAKDCLKAALTEGETVTNEKPVDLPRNLLLKVEDDTQKYAFDSQDEILITINTLKDLLFEKQAAIRNEAFWPATANLIRLVNAKKYNNPSKISDEIAGVMAKAIGESLRNKLVPFDSQEAAINQLISLSYHSSPKTNSTIQLNFERVISWGTDSVRVDVADALSKLIDHTEIWPIIRNRYEELLLTDPHPAVRMYLISALPRLWHGDNEAMLNIATKFEAKETNKSVLSHWATSLSNLVEIAPDKLEPFFLNLTNKEISVVTGENIVPKIISFFGLIKGMPASKRILSNWVNDFKENEQLIHHVLFHLRSYFCIGYKNENEQENFARTNVISFLQELIGAVESDVKSWPTARKATDREISALKLFNEIAAQIFYAIGYEKSMITLSKSMQSRFLNEYGAIMSQLSIFGTPNSVHHILQVLKKLLEAEPIKCFDIFSEAMLRKTGVAKYEHEPMGARLFVELVGLYMADYRSIFVNEKRREKLIDCLAVFVDAGWTEARRLFQLLPELR